MNGNLMTPLRYPGPVKSLPLPGLRQFLLEFDQGLIILLNGHELDLALTVSQGPVFLFQIRQNFLGLVHLFGPGGKPLRIFGQRFQLDFTIVDLLL